MCSYRSSDGLAPRLFQQRVKVACDIEHETTTNFGVPDTTLLYKATQVALNLATDFRDKNVVIHTPLMALTKADEFELARELGCLDLILNQTMTCYEGVTTRHAFGLGCGLCPACVLRKKGYEEFMKRVSERN